MTMFPVLRLISRWLLLPLLCIHLVKAVQFTNTFYDYQIAGGDPVNLTWTGAVGPVTLTLKNGSTTNPVTVSVIASGLTGTLYTWIPSQRLTVGIEYEMEIDDSSGVPGYSSRWFQIEKFAGDPVDTMSSSSSTARTSSRSTLASITSSPTPFASTTPPSSSTPSTSTQSSSPAPTSSSATTAYNSSLSTGAKAGIGVGVALGILLLIGISGFIFFQRGKRAAKPKETNELVSERHEKAELGGQPVSVSARKSEPLTEDERTELERRRAAKLEEVQRTGVVELAGWNGNERAEVEDKSRVAKAVVEIA